MSRLGENEINRTTFFLYVSTLLCTGSSVYCIVQSFGLETETTASPSKWSLTATCVVFHSNHHFRTGPVSSGEGHPPLTTGSDWLSSLWESPLVAHTRIPPVWHPCLTTAFYSGGSLLISLVWPQVLPWACHFQSGRASKHDLLWLVL